jgi:type I restriction enzyme, S subunit
MDSSKFFAEFRHIVSAPGGLHQIRQLIYNLAITGKLTSRSYDDDDIELLLSNVKTIKERLIAENLFKSSPKLENLPLGIPEDIKLPDSWRWSRLVDIGEINPRNRNVSDSI